MVSQVPGGILVERRNRYFHVWSADARPDGNPDEIDWLLGRDRNKQVAMVESGQADGQFQEIPRTQADRLLRERPSQVYLTPNGPLGAPGFALDPRRFPISSTAVRRAINLALDRSKITAVSEFPTVPTCQAIRAGVAGYAPYCPYTVDGLATGEPRVAKARRLVRDAHAVGARVSVALVPDWSEWNDWRIGLGPSQDQLLATLRAIGLRPVVRWLPRDADNPPTYDDHPQIRWACCNEANDTPPAFGDLNSVTGGCDRQAIADGAFCDAETRRLWKKALAQTEPIAQAQAWAAIDHHLTDLAAWLPIGTGNNTVFLGKGVGNYAQQMQLGGSLWELLTVR
jgi:peptide/nickel transport system substrate-binding protein